ncbi:MAG: ABC transporter substrate-binding protein [Clostridia bacterium]|nr:ABC transporter substrate-binding protein [Clostridia bacterium]
MKKLMALVLAVLMALSFGAMAEDEVIKLRWACGTGGTAPIENALVVEALNKISREKIGVEVEYIYFTNDQLLNEIELGVEYDIYFTCSWYNETNGAIASGLFANIAPVLKDYPGVYNALAQEIWDLCTTPDGGIYAIPNRKDYAIINYFSYPVEIAEQLGYEFPEKIEDWNVLTDFLVDWKATLPENEYPVLLGGSVRGMDSAFDHINRDVKIGCTYGTTKVISMFEDEEMMKRFQILGEWYDLGLINPEAPTTTENAIPNTALRLDSKQAWPGYSYDASHGYKTGMIRYFGPGVSKDGVQGSMNAIGKALENDPEKLDAAMKVFELIFTDQLYKDTLRYGVQGYHWDYATAADTSIEELVGKVVVRKDGASDNYGPWAFAQPDYFGTSFVASEDVLKGESEINIEQYNMYFDLIAKEPVTSALGAFTWDMTGWDAQIAEIKNIYSEYYASIATGAIHIDEVYEEMMGKLNAAGLQEIIADAQAQLDAYLGK